ncbi:hypothetical protein A33O_20910 [Nitratireductor aquibiodomus RA22]|uniref:Uncharacterized protein n=1 Tax=Nitratireductor aquibiodomus RA22 TaxID=1189611 RepID=I5BRS4_9HYPH|nr:hypothetical protein [Nitratireductor aquibiodomus]EIM72276.1 hypothetical protein A33O_20910 [Nitratireductor aquibiodomus RA22]
MRALGRFGAGIFLLILLSFAARAVELHEGITYRSGLKLDIHAPDRSGRTAQAGVVRMNLFSFGGRRRPW